MELKISFKERILRMGYVALKDFIKYSSELENLLYIIGSDKDPRPKKSAYELLIKNIKPGSQAFELVPGIQKTLFGATPIDKAVESFQIIMDVLDKDVNGSNYDEILNFIKSPEKRFQIYNSLREFTVKSGIIEISLKKTPDAEFKKIFIPKRRYNKSLIQWQKLEIQEKRIKFLGALTVLHGEGDKYFGIRNENGDYFKYRYPESEEKKYIQYYKKVLEITGLYIPIKNLLKKIENMKIRESILLDNLFDLKFKYPLKLKLEFMEDAFFGINEELNIIATGKTIEDMYADLYGELITDIKLYITSGTELTTGAKKLRQKLLDLIETNRK